MSSFPLKRLFFLISLFNPNENVLIAPPNFVRRELWQRANYSCKKV